MTGIIKATIGSTDVTSYLKGWSTQAGGTQSVGRANLYLDRDAGGLDLRTLQDVKVWMSYNDAGAGVAQNGRLFGGLVASRTTGNVGTQKTWTLPCYDWNALPDMLMTDADSNPIILGAAHFSSQMQTLVQTVQYNGHGAVGSGIDATSKVLDFGAMPSITLPRGLTLAQYIQKLCDAARVAYPTTRPKWFITVDDAYGVGEVFHGPVLSVYDGALMPASVATFSDTPGVGENYIYGTFTRTTDATSNFAERRQIRWHRTDRITEVWTAVNDTAQALYPCPYINHGKAGNAGYWMLPPVDNSDAQSSAEAQGIIGALVEAEAYPRDTYKFETDVYLKPRDPVKITWALEALSAVTMRVAEVQVTVKAPNKLWFAVSVNNRRLGLLDGGDQDINAVPQEGDQDPPGAPTWAALSAWIDLNRYNPNTDRTDVIVHAQNNPEPDWVATQYRYRYRGSYWSYGGWEDKEDIHFRILGEVPPGTTLDFQAKAKDSFNNESAWSVTKTLVAAPAISYGLYNGGFEYGPTFDGNLPEGWALTAVGSGAAFWDQTQPLRGYADAMFQVSTSPSTSSAKLTSMQMYVKPLKRYQIGTWACATVAVSALTVKVNWYDINNTLISTVTLVSKAALQAGTLYYPYFYYATAPATTVSATLDIMLDTPASAVTMYADIARLGGVPI